MKNLFLLVTASIISLASCSSSQQQPVVEKDTGRRETKKLEATTAVGYDGVAIRKSVDNALNKNDDHNKDLDKQDSNSK
jgi:hypothetical protein